MTKTVNRTNRISKVVW